MQNVKRVVECYDRRSGPSKARATPALAEGLEERLRTSSSTGFWRGLLCRASRREPGWQPTGPMATQAPKCVGKVVNFYKNSRYVAVEAAPLSPIPRGADYTTTTRGYDRRRQ